jgi:starvation-inducible DNA-binding protein
MSKSPSRVANLPAAAIAQKLQVLLQDTYAVFLVTHNYHWNVEGPNFVGLHTLFEQQYTEQFAAVDEIAERIRALGSYSLEGDYGAVAKKIAAVKNPVAENARHKDGAARHMIENLIELHENVVASAQSAKQAAEKAGDDESVDLAVGRITVHQKALWMLGSLLK